MMLVGLIWAMGAPLILVAAVAVLVYLLSVTGLSSRTRIAAATAIVVMPVAVIWWIDYREFQTVCKDTGKPRIFVHSVAEGIFLDSPTANSFGMNYLHEQGFAWMEIRSIYDRNKFERLTRNANGQISTVPIDTTSARYEVKETFEKPFSHTSLNMKRIIDRQTGQVMAQAGSAHFDGGLMKWVLGAYGTRSYPSAMTNSEDFKDYYYLAQRALQSPQKTVQDSRN